MALRAAQLPLDAAEGLGRRETAPVNQTPPPATVGAAHALFEQSAR